MCTVLDRGGNITSCVRRMCRDTQGIHPSRRGDVRKNKRECGGMVNIRGKDEEKKNIRSVE